jgi:hypothetical protein
MGMTRAGLMVELAALFVGMSLGYRFSPVRPGGPLDFKETHGVKLLRYWTASLTR